MNKRADVLSSEILKRLSKEAEADIIPQGPSKAPKAAPSSVEITKPAILKTGGDAGELEKVLRNMGKQAQENPPEPPKSPEPPGPESAAIPEVVPKVPVEPIETVSDDKSGKTEEGVQQTAFISKELADLLNRQIGNEMFASYSYYAAFGWFDDKGLDGFAKFVDAQAKDEIGHAMKIYKFMLDSGMPVVMPAIPSPKAAYANAREIVEDIFNHEKGVTADWRVIGKKAAAEGDAATSELAQWFVTEQLEEENKILGIHQRLKLDPSEMAVLMVDATLR